MSALAPYAELAVSNVTAPSLTIGDPAQVTIGWTVTNHGTGAGSTASWVDAVIASTDDNPNDGTTLAQFTHTGLLSVGGSYIQSQTFLLPPDFEGSYHLFVETDAGNVVFQNGLTANKIAEAPNLFDVTPTPYAELVVSAVTVPATASSGQPVQISWTVTNQGIGTTNTSAWSDNVYLASDPAGSNVVADLGAFDHEGALGVNVSYTQIVDATLPNGLNGTFYVVVQTSGPYQFIYTDNNSAVSADPVVVALTPAPDLTPTLVEATAPGSSVALTAANAGDKIDVTWTVQNIGPGDADGTWTDDVQMQPVGGNGPSYDLGSFSLLRLAAGRNVLYPHRASAIAGRRPGCFPVRADNRHHRLALRRRRDREQHLYGAGPAYDLHRGAIPMRTCRSSRSPPPPRARPAARSPWTSRSSIKGPEPANGQWTDSVYLSLDDTVDSTSTLLGSFANQSALMPGQSYQTQTGDMVIPESFGGPGYLIVWTNSGGNAEFDPNTNGTTFVSPITVTPFPPADLVTSDVAAPVQAFDGSTITVQYTVSNLGLGPTNVADWTDTIWLTTDPKRPNPSKGDVLLATLPHSGTLGDNGSVIAPPQSYTVSTTVTLPTHISGQYYIMAWADSFNNVIKTTLRRTSTRTIPTSCTTTTTWRPRLPCC